MAELPIVNVYLAREMARRGDRDDAIPLMRAALDHLFREGQLLVWGTPATGVLVQTLLDRAADGDVAEAEDAIERLATAPADDGLVLRDIWLLRMRCCWRGRKAMTLPTVTTAIATARWPQSLHSYSSAVGPVVRRSSPTPGWRRPLRHPGHPMSVGLACPLSRSLPTASREANPLYGGCLPMGMG